jgi:DNA-binding PadR family transcriptional regulator
MKASLLVLAMLHRGDLHPYEMKRRFAAAMVDCYLGIDTGTLYYAVRQLEKDGAITALSREHVARGGIRTVYRLTDTGQIRFQKEFWHQLDEDGPVSQTLYGVLLCLHLVDPVQLTERLHARLERIDAVIASHASLRSAIGSRLGTGGDQLLHHVELQRRLDRDWLATLILQIETQGLRDAPPLAVSGQ